MRLYTFDVKGRVARRPLLGVEEGGVLIDLAAAYAASVEARASVVAGEGTSEGLPLRGLPMLLAAGERGLAAAAEALRFAREAGGSVAGHLRYGFDEVRLRPPLLRPGKILCAGVNYLSHMTENPAATKPEEPFIFAKLPSGVIGPGDPIVKPAQTEQLDYEVELAVVIGRTMRDVVAERALEHVAGYTIMNDVSARDVQFRNNQITLGKNFDTFAPMGPCAADGRRGPRPEPPAFARLGQRRVAPGRDRRRHDFRHPRAAGAPVGGDDAGAGRRGQHRHAGRRRRLPPAARVSSARRCRVARDRWHRAAGEPGVGAGG